MAYVRDEPGTTGRRRRWAAVLVVPLALAGAACGDDETSDAGDEGIVQEVEDAGESAGALGLAEAMRVTLLAEDVGDDVDRHSVDVLRESADDLPGSPDVIGITDDDGDGRDDDGNVELRVDDEAACLTVEGDSDVAVGAGPCDGS
jgi:hypothetical protein